MDVAACCCMCFMLLHMCNPVASLLETRMTCLNPDSSYYYSVFAGCNAILKNFAALFLRGGEWANRLTENVPILQDFVPYQGGCPASPHENQGESRAGQGNCWPFDTFGQLFHIQILSGFKVCHYSFQRLFLKWFFFQFLLWWGAGRTAYWSFLGPVWPDSWHPPTHSPQVAKKNAALLPATLP